MTAIAGPAIRLFNRLPKREATGEVLVSFSFIFHKLMTPTGRSPHWNQPCCVYDLGSLEVMDRPSR